MTAKAFTARATIIGTDPVRAAALHAHVQRIGLNMRAQLGRVKSPAARARVMQLANALIDAEVRATLEEALPARRAS